MSQYVEKNLIRDEKVVLKAKINPLALAGKIVWAILLIVIGIVFNTQMAGIDPEAGASLGMIALCVCLVIGLVPLLIGAIDLACTALAVTNKRVVGKTGVLKVASLDLHIEKVDNVTMNATFFGRLFRFYTVTIKGSGDGTGIKFKGLSNGPQLKNAITEAIEKHADEARKAQAAEIAMAMRGRNN